MTPNCRDLSSDEKFMTCALALARRGEGCVSPNPVVGCVIVKNGKFIASGYHKKYGADHAEVAALKKAGARAKGADLYVTLEPCFHWGRTPPCVDAVIKAGISRVVIAMRDPNRLTNGKSLRKLKRAGIDVVTGVCGTQARRLNAPFVKYITRKLPYVTVKSAVTIDGKTADRFGGSKWITGEPARDKARARRGLFDAIVAGVGTVLADDPGLGADKFLYKVIVDSRLRTPAGARLFAGTTPGQVILATTAEASPARAARLRKTGAEILVVTAKDGRVDIAALFRILAERKIVQVLVEGGAELAGSVIREDLADRLHIYIAPRLLGDALARGMLAGPFSLRMDQSGKLNFVTVERIGEDIFIDAEVRNVHRDS